ncbi:peptidoglycan-binding protein [Natranaerobius trueperi]|uniref:Peptidoglycan-binding protein n=2 Tax=Natranaerobius trueperi TaxID=759412 RepID=A0A226BWR5_9FIRM|nr:peptidoglycan-binding protein [Natranaerobius trueperi]
MFKRRYTVEEGDTFISIAREFNVSVDALINANPHIEDPDVLFPGDVLCVPKKPLPDPREPKKCPPKFRRRYTVEEGDTFFIIANKFNVSVDELVEANPHIEDPAVIFPGDVLCVPRKRKW